MTLAIVAALAIGQDQPPPPDHFTPKMAAPVGSQAAYDLRIAFEVAGVKLVYEARQIHRVIKISPAGWVVTSQDTSAKLTQGSSKMEFKSLPPKTLVFGPSGTPLKVEGKKVDPTDAAFARLTSWWLPQRPVKLNEVWTESLPAHPEQGLPPAEAACRVTGEDKVNGAPCLRIACEVTETKGEAPAKSKSVFYVAKATGETQKASADLDRAPLVGHRAPAQWTLVKVKSP
jgi:hypothetical protein